MIFVEPVRLRHPLYFFRHGQTDWNREKRCQGLTDIPLNETGREQARCYARVLKKLTARRRKPFRFVASPLQRTMETMAIIREELGLPRDGFETDERLIEIDHGQWGGHTYDQIREKWPEEYAALQEDKWTVRRPDGESYEDRLDPVTTFLKDMSEPAIVVGHGGTGRVMRAVIAGHPPSQAVHLPMLQTEFIAFERGSETIHSCEEA